MPAAIASQLADAAHKREDLETEKRAAGVLGLDMYTMRESLEKAGMRYID